MQKKGVIRGSSNLKYKYSHDHSNVIAGIVIIFISAILVEGITSETTGYGSVLLKDYKTNMISEEQKNPLLEENVLLVPEGRRKKSVTGCNWDYQGNCVRRKYGTKECSYLGKGGNCKIINYKYYDLCMCLTA